MANKEVKEAIEEYANKEAERIDKENQDPLFTYKAALKKKIEGLMITDEQAIGITSDEVTGYHQALDDTLEIMDE